jgi:hypothetical protein
VNGLIVLLGNASLKEYLSTKFCWMQAIFKNRWYKSVCKVRERREGGDMSTNWGGQNKQKSSKKNLKNSKKIK